MGISVIVEFVILIMVLVLAPVSLMVGIFGPDTSLRKWLSVLGAFLTPVTVLALAVIAGIGVSTAGDAFLAIAAYVLSLFVLAFGAAFVVIADEKMHIQKWCARICGIVVFVMAVNMFVGTCMIMGVTPIAKNTVPEIEDGISSYLDQGTDLQTTDGANFSVGGNATSSEFGTTGTKSPKEQTIQIGLTQESQTPRMDAANQGILQALEDSKDDSGIEYQVDQQNASGEHYVQQVILNHFGSQEYAAIIAISSGADSYDFPKNIPYFMISNAESLTADEAYRRGYDLGKQIAESIQER